MQQSKKRKKSRFLDFWEEKNVIKRKSIKLLRPYFNQQFNIMLYVYVTVCCLRVLKLAIW